ncbi:MAG: peptidylprolyl isomerase [Bacteroidetes bacterium]|nr:peptidylprolyl isomerase [Bacteroidota bacterium]
MTFKLKKSTLMKNLLSLFLIVIVFNACSQSDGADVIISTDFGDMRVKLYDDTPKHKENFLKLAREGYYDSLLFHRVIQYFMVQGGDPDSKNADPEKQLGQGGPDYTLKPEFNDTLYHVKGALAAARMPDHQNPGKESSGSQFYIVHGVPGLSDEAMDRLDEQLDRTTTPAAREKYKQLGGTPHLDGDYTVFGEVISGLDIIDSIAAAGVDMKTRRPTKDIRMKITVIE